MKNYRKSLLACMMYCCLTFMPLCCAATATPDTAKNDNTARGAFYGFGEMEIIKLDWAMSKPIIADINHDNLNDIIVVNNRKSRIELLLQKAEFDPNAVISTEAETEDDNVNDIFGCEKAWRFKRVSFPLDVAVASMVIADVNNDSLLDIAYYAKEGLYIVLQDSSSPKPNTNTEHSAPIEPRWQVTQKIDITDGLAISGALSSADLNNDGKIDLALPGSQSVIVLIQTDDGKLAKPIRHNTTAKKIRQLELADIDGDGLSDIVILTGDRQYPLRVCFQTAAGHFGAELRYKLPYPAVMEISRFGQSTKSLFLTISDQSGRVLISQLPANVQPEQFPVHVYPLAPTQQAKNRDIISADVDGDSFADIVISDPSRAEFILFRTKDGGGLDVAQKFPGFKDMRKLCPGQLGNSTDIAHSDAVVVLSVDEKLIGITRFSKSRLTYPAIVDIIGEPQAIDLADINNDGSLDLVYISKQKEQDDSKSEKSKKTPKTTYTLRTILDLGQAKAKPGPQVLLSELKDKPTDIRTADIDHDGNIDVMILRSYGPMLLVRQPTLGTFNQVSPKEINAGLVDNVYPNTLSIATLDQDQSSGNGNDHKAILLAQKNFARALVFDPDKGYQVVDQYQAENTNSNITAATACKLNDDETISIVTYDSARNKLSILEKQSDGTYRITKEIDTPNVSVKKILSGNFGRGSLNNLLIAGYDKLLLLPNTAQTYQLREEANFEIDIKKGRYGSIGIGDINSDSMTDIILCEQARHHIEILTFDPQGALVSATKFKVFEEPRGQSDSQYENIRGKGTGQPRAAVIGDVTSDSRNDLILLLHDRLIIYPQN